MEKVEIEIQVCSRLGGEDRMLQTDVSGKRKRVEQENTSSQLNESVEEIVLPFAKRSPYWKEFETMEAFRITPQRPHFLPLLKAYDHNLEFIRESIAVGLMMGYSEYSDIVRNLDNEAPVSKLMHYKKTFVALEEHGFHVGEILSKIDEVLSVKAGQGNTSEEPEKKMRDTKDGQGDISEEPEKKMTDESTKEPKRNKSSNTTLSRCNTTLLRCKSNKPL
ncbi:unnamed protein product [Microthlaspi erraticum]|uniref:Uncharacterized protein n=1 Tax=Microthlaspi erraticum TaxID=1685480 RepID=A0A6D2KNE4_9BRAS|nr:unnamed protein product [Microthlaspi erraticum]